MLRNRNNGNSYTTSTTIDNDILSITEKTLKNNTIYQGDDEDNNNEDDIIKLRELTEKLTKLRAIAREHNLLSGGEDDDADEEEVENLRRKLIGHGQKNNIPIEEKPEDCLFAATAAFGFAVFVFIGVVLVAWNIPPTLIYRSAILGLVSGLFAFSSGWMGLRDERFSVFTFLIASCVGIFLGCWIGDHVQIHLPPGPRKF